MPCSWEIDRSCLPPLPVVGTGEGEVAQEVYDEALSRQNTAEDTAVMVLWSLSGRQFGACEYTIRPCPAQGFPAYPWLGSDYLVLMLDATRWTHSPCGCVGGCEVSGPRVVHLPGPAAAIVAVTIDGVVLPDAEYQLEGDALYRTGGASWPSQNLGAPLGETGTWSVTYTRGLDPPAGAAKMAGQLALEFIAACDDETTCRLPRTLVATNQRGNSHVFDQSKILKAGKTGLPEVDLWLAAVNPNHLLAAAEVL